MKTKSTVLTREERDILILAALHPHNRHLTNTEIAERLCISANKVKTLIHQASLKLGAHNRNEAVILAMRWGEISLDEFYSLDELSEIVAGLGPDMLITIAQLVRQEPEHGRFPMKDEQIIHIDRKQHTILTDRERDVLILVARGLTNREIADTLYISISTVRNTLNGACAKLGARNRADAAIIALKQGEVNVGEIFSLNELVQFLAPLGTESIETMSQLLNQKLEQKRIPAGGQ